MDGEPHFTLSQVALNDTIMVVAFAPIVGLLLGLSAITVPWDTLVLSVVLYIVVPVIVAQLWRRRAAGLRRAGGAARHPAAAWQPVSLSALLATLVLLFGLQGEQILRQPLVIALLAVPILIQVYFNAGLAYWLNRRLGVAAVRRRALGADRRLQLLRAGGGGRHRPVRLPVGRGARHGGRRAGRGAGDAVGRAIVEAYARLVRAACSCMTYFPAVVACLSSPARTPVLAWSCWPPNVQVERVAATPA